MLRTLLLESPNLNCIMLRYTLLVLVILFVQSGSAQEKIKLPSYFSSVALNKPVIFAENVISTGDFESHPAFSPGGDTLYFVKSAPDFSTWTICVSFFRNGKWTKPEVAPFSGKYNDADPFITFDGEKLFFISDRPVNKNDSAKTDTDIWMMQKTKSGWSQPTHVDYPVSSNASEWYPTLTKNSSLYFGSGREGGKGKTDLYKCSFSNNKYSEAVNLGDSINTAFEEYEPFIAPDESYLIFMAIRPEGIGGGDFFISYNKKGIWSKAKSLGEPFNSPGTKYSPKISPDNKYFFFSSTRTKQTSSHKTIEDYNELLKRIYNAGNSLGDIYQTDIKQLQLQINN